MISQKDKCLVCVVLESGSSSNLEANEALTAMYLDVLERRQFSISNTVSANYNPSMWTHKSRGYSHTLLQRSRLIQVGVNYTKKECRVIKYNWTERLLRCECARVWVSNQQLFTTKKILESPQFSSYLGIL